MLEALVYITVHTCVVDIIIDHVLTVISIVLVPFKVTSRLHKSIAYSIPSMLASFFVKANVIISSIFSCRYFRCM